MREKEGEKERRVFVSFSHVKRMTMVFLFVLSCVCFACVRNVLGVCVGAVYVLGAYCCLFFVGSVCVGAYCCLSIYLLLCHKFFPITA